MKKFPIFLMKSAVVAGLVASIGYFGVESRYLEASSHREAPMIANDPQADNTDLYAFRSPDKPGTVTVIADYIGLELPQGGPNYAQFGSNINYDIHVKNNAATKGDDITYRFTFTNTNEDPTTFFNIRLGKQNLKTTYTCMKSVNGGAFTTIVSNGVVPPPNIGARSIGDATAGLGKPYATLMANAVTTASTGETVFCGGADDPFFVDLGGIFDLGGVRQGSGLARDGVGCTNVHVISLQIPIATLQKDGKTVDQAKNILDGDFVIGVWASASRPAIRTIDSASFSRINSGNYVQISRLGMPLTNEAIIPIGMKDKWNFQSPYSNEAQFEGYFTNPELGLYMDNRLFGSAVPGLNRLRIQTKSQTVLGAVDFGYGKDGLNVIKGHPATKGTALDTALFGNYLLRAGNPRSVDILPIFYVGVPNLAPYQLAVGKTPGNPLTAGKPFINNFLPTFGDMLRLNMAVPATPRNDPRFSSEGLLAAAVIGLTDTTYNKTTAIQAIPNMDGFPNGRRLEDDVTRIELQAVGGIVLAAVGLWYDDWTIGQSPLTPNLLRTLSFNTDIDHNDKPFQTAFPYVAIPHSGDGPCGGTIAGTNFSGNDLKVGSDKTTLLNKSQLNIGAPNAVIQAAANPFTKETSFTYRLSEKGHVSIAVYDMKGAVVKVLEDSDKDAGNYNLQWNAQNQTNGLYFVRLLVNGEQVQTMKISKTE